MYSSDEKLYPHSTPCHDCYECHKLWTKERKIEVPYQRDGIAVLHIQRIIKASTINGLPVDLLITARATLYSEPVEFAVVFAEEPPPERTYPMPVLWRRCNSPLLGKWIKPKGKV